MELPELQEFVEGFGEKRYRAEQLFRWIYGKCTSSFDEMTDISSSFRSFLQEHAALGSITEVHRSTSLDGTIKFLFRLSDEQYIESVLIPPSSDTHDADHRLTICVSTQVGCPVGCVFCATGTMGFTRNLTAGEIVEQVIVVQRHSSKRISNIVFMGMGEPMLNYENVLKAISLLNDDKGLNIGARHITLSTAGYAEKIRLLAHERIPVKLALSLHTLDDTKRKQLMPIARKYSVDELIDALVYYYRVTRRRPTLEYILFENFNDTEDDCQRLIELGKRLPCKVNLIPYHPIDFVRPSIGGLALKPTSPDAIEQFAHRLRKGNLTVMVRRSSGKDIRAACGQLAVLKQHCEEAYG